LNKRKKKSKSKNSKTENVEKKTTKKKEVATTPISVPNPTPIHVINPAVNNHIEVEEVVKPIPQPLGGVEAIEKKGPLSVKVSLRKVPVKKTDDNDQSGPIPMQHDIEDENDSKPSSVVISVPTHRNKISDITHEKNIDDDPQNLPSALAEKFTFSQPCNYSSDV